MMNEIDFKRVMDLLLAIPALVLCWPTMVLIAVVIRFTSPGPVIISHDRVGKNGRIFCLYKFRTMQVDANPHAVAPSHQHDAQIIPFGQWLRKCRLDELPLLWNVIKGDMSLFS
jgi:lipopolysaccharide/colanic/teichoic acid biosynthesis glycosyltransferase